MYLHVKLQKNKIWLRYLKVVKRQEKYDWCIWRIKHNKKCTIYVFRDEDRTRKVQMMYLSVEMQQMHYHCGI